MKINFLKYYPFFAGVSLLLVIVCLVIIFLKGLNYGTDFTGGIELTISFSEERSAQSIESDLVEAGFNPEVERLISRKNSFRIRHLLLIDPTVTEDRFENFFREKYGTGFELEQIYLVGGVLSSQNKSNALITSLIVVSLIILYLSFRFNFFYSLASMVAVIHDLALMLGFLVFMGIEMQVLIVVALLTIFGYSVNDSIILFDRIREKQKDFSGTRYKDLLNLALNSVFSRTLITSFTTLIVVLALFLSTEGSYRNFAAIIIVGVFSGTYSSIYVACTFMMLWDKKKPQLNN